VSGSFAPDESPNGVRAGELRIDPLSGRRVILAETDRVLETPPEPAAPSAQPLLGGRADREADLFWAAPAHGEQKLLRGAPGLAATLEGWREQMRECRNAACLHLAADSASLPAAWLYALPFVPAEIARERERFGAYATRTMGGNLLGDLLQEEVRKRERVVAIDGEAVLLSAFAARGPYALMLIPRTPRARFEDDGPSGAALLEQALGRLARRLPGTIIDLWVRTAPQGAEHFCWRIDLLPRQTTAPPLGLGAGIAVNPVTPEQAAAELREA
jgi:UDPglucose--hexose-1-phosphate uridylyltransferase